MRAPLYVVAAVALFAWRVPGAADSEKIPASDRAHPLDICSISKLELSSGKTLAWVRGRLKTGGHEAFITGDDRCENAVVFLHDGKGRASVIGRFCDDGLAPRFGCPPGNDNGPVVTVVGMLWAPLKIYGSGKYAFLDLTDLMDIASIEEWKAERRRRGP